MTKLRIGVWGASVTWGARDLEKGGWVARLRNYFDITNPSFVYNLGVSGATTSDLLERFAIEAKARRPDIVIFSIGTNDASYIQEGINSVPISQFHDNITELVHIAKNFTEKIIFLGIGLVDEMKTLPWRQDEGKNYNNAVANTYTKILRDICVIENIFFLDISDIFNAEDVPDGIHPNAQGHEKIYEKVRDFMLGNKLI